MKDLMSNRWILVSNRLPFSQDPQTGELRESSGGLVGAITGIHSPREKIWVGTAPADTSEEDWRKISSKQFKKYIPVYVSKKSYDRYYNGFSNDVLWPLFHYESGYVNFQWEDWLAYKRVNEQIAEAVIEEARGKDQVWIHDFHLFLLPKLIKQKNPKIKVGFFLHIPFPSSEVFRQLPVRKEILEALLESDLIGFHDYSYLRHFCASLQLILGLDSSLLTVRYKGRTTHLGVFPVTIDTKKFQENSKKTEVKKRVKKLKKEMALDHLILGVDRLDYTKGIELKLLAFQMFLRKHPEYQQRVSLLQIAVPTRMEVPEYIRLKQDVEKLVGEINGEFGRPNYNPVNYIYSSVSFDELLALYQLADVLLITSKRDGMNLVALEFICAQNPKDPGVVLLSEFAGAISTLSHVTPVNPWDILATSRQLAEALEVSKSDRIQKNQPMVNYLEKYTASHWAETFMTSLEKVGGEEENQIVLEKKQEVVKLPEDIKKQLKGRELIIFVDYDGTLVPIFERPEDAVLASKTKSLLKALSKKENVQLVVVSGRNSQFLTEQFKDINIVLAAEHGAKFYNQDKNRWKSLVMTNSKSWQPMAQQIMNDYSERVPGSFVEKKEHSISWHYRNSPAEFASYQSRKLREELEVGMSNLPVSVIGGKKIVEARTIEANKGAFARWYLDSFNNISENEVILAIGDDETDEDLFVSMPEGKSMTIKVGEGETQARYRLNDQAQVLEFLSALD